MADLHAPETTGAPTVDDARWRRSIVVPGFVASTAVTVGALVGGWVPLAFQLNDGFIGDLRDSTLWVTVARLLIVAGITVLLHLWLVMGSDALQGRAGSPDRLRRTLAVWIAPLLLCVPLFSRDVYSYYAQGRLLANGYDPYANGVSVLEGWFKYGVDPLWGETPTPYGPLSLLLQRGVADLAGDSALTAAVLFRLLCVAGVAIMAYAIPRLAYDHGIDPTVALWLAVANPLVLMHFVIGAHNDALMVGLMTAGFALAARSRFFLGVVLIALAVAIKPIALLALPFVGLMWAGTTASWRRRVAMWAITLGVSVATIAAVARVAGVDWGWIAALTTPGAVETWLSPPTAVGKIIGGALQGLGLLDSSASIVAITRAIGLLAAFAIIALLLLRPQGRSPVRGAAIAFAALVALGPVVQAWYLLWPLSLVAVTGLRKVWHLRVIIIGTAAFVFLGLVDASTTQHTLLDLSVGLTYAAALLAVAVAIFAIPSERALVLGSQLSQGLRPVNPDAVARSRELVFTGPLP